MFTGIVAAVGHIERVEPQGPDAGVRLTIDAAGLDLHDVEVGDSIAVQGACMTVVGLDGGRFLVDVSAESLSKTAGLDAPGEVNLEKALRLADRLGGHLVSGHVDGIGEVVSFEPIGESWRLVVRADARFAKYLAYKGSVTVDGVSLTVNRVADVRRAEVLRGAKDARDGADAAPAVEFEINLVPHTICVTTLRSLHAGKRVNLEVDLIARYVERMLDEGHEAAPPRG